MCDSYYTITHHMSVIGEATPGALLLWDKTMGFPEIQHMPSSFFAKMKHQVFKLRMPTFVENMLFLRRNIIHYAENKENHEELLSLIPRFACGIKNIQQSYFIHAAAMHELGAMLRLTTRLSCDLLLSTSESANF